MIKFFRKIRYNLIENNKIRKYLQYAFGEIVLVVIGILIALQINNWNEGRKESNLETHVLNEISENLTEDILSLNNDIRLNENGIKNVQFIENVLATNGTLSDTLLRQFSRVTFNPTYSLKKSGYLNLAAIGFHIIAEDTVRKSITNLYETQYSFLKEREETSEKSTYEYLNTRYLEYFREIKFDISEDQYDPFISYHPKSFENMSNDPDFQRLLDYAKQIKYDNLYDIKMVLTAIRDTKNLIDTYLKEK